MRGDKDTGIHRVHGLFHSDLLLYWKDKLLGHFFSLAADNLLIMLILEFLFFYLFSQYDNFSRAPNFSG